MVHRSHRGRVIEALRFAIENMEQDPDVGPGSPDVLALKRILSRQFGGRAERYDDSFEGVIPFVYQQVDIHPKVISD